MSPPAAWQFDVHAAKPVEVPNAKNSVHIVDEVAPGPTDVPCGHFWHEIAPGDWEYVPALQSTQLDEAVEAENFPAVQLEHEDASAEEYFPAPQISQLAFEFAAGA